MPRGARIRSTLAVVAPLVASVCVLFPRAILSGESFYERDLIVDWYQRLHVLARCLREGSWPLWDPSLGFGEPLLADPGAQVLYPPALAAFLLPLAWGYTAFVLAHLALGALGTARLSSALGAGRIGAAAAGSLWALSGPIQSVVNLRHHLAGAAWMPWVLLAADGAARAPGPRAVAAIAVTASLQLLAGSPEASLMTALLATAWVGGRLLERTGRWRRAVPVVALGTVLAAGLSAIQWWPALVLLARSGRVALAEDVRGHWAVPAEGLLRLVVPLDPARVPYGPPLWARLFDGPEVPFLPSIYVGAPTLLLVLVALGAAGRRRTRALALALAVVLALACAMGPHSPLFGWATSLVPPLRVLRYPSKALLAAAPLVALLAGVGIGAIAHGRPRSRWVVCGAIALIVGAAIDAWHLVGVGPWLLGPALAGLGVATLLLVARARIRPPLAAILLSALCAVDLLAAHLDLNATARLAPMLEPPPVASAVDRSEGRRLLVYDYHSLREASRQHLGRLDPYRVAEPPPGVDRRSFQALARRLYMPLGMAGLFGLENSYDLDIRGLYPRELDDVTLALRVLEGTPAQVKMLRMGAVGTVLSLHTSGLTNLRLVATLPSLFPEPIYVWRVPAALPRAWLVGCSRPVTGAAALKTLTDPGFDPAREVILPEGSPIPADCGAAGRAQLTALHSDEIRLEVAAERAGYLVLANAFDPGWQVTIDGTGAPLLRANVAFQAVSVAAGLHRVRLVYRPREVLQGAAVTAVSGLFAVGIALAGAARSRRRRFSRAPGAPAPEAPA